MSLGKVKLRSVVKTVAVLGLGLYAGVVSANGSNSVGIGLGGFGTSEYRDYDGGTVPVPMINVSNEIFYLRGLTAGAYLYADQTEQLSVIITYHAQSFEASESNHADMKKLDDRDSTAMAGLSYNVNITQYDSLRFRALFDILDETDGGYLLDAGYQARIPVVADQVTVSPGFGVTWSNDKLNEHYYGVSAAEASRTSFSQYSPDGSFSPYLSLGINVRLTDSINFFANGSYAFLSDEVKDSPMVDRSGAISGVVGMSMNF